MQRPENSRICPKCNGIGVKVFLYTIIYKECNRCNGSGFLLAEDDDD